MEIRIQQWLKKLHRQRLEPGQIAELEAHLRDTIDELLIKGFSEEEAFTEAEQRVGNLKSIAKQEWNVHRKYAHFEIQAFFKHTFRHLSRYKGYAALNVAGLSIAFLVSIFLLAYLQYETSYDTSLPRNVYRISVIDTAASTRATATQLPMGLDMATTFPEVEAVARTKQHRVLLSTDAISEYEDMGLQTDPDIIGIMRWDVLASISDTLLRSKDQIVLTESLAMKYFGTTQATGKTMTIDRKQQVQVAGIIRDTPKNSHMQVSYLLAFPDSLMGFSTSQWNAVSTGRLYVELAAGTNPLAFSEKLTAWAHTKIEYSPDRTPELFALQPVKDIYLYGEKEYLNAVDRSGDARYIRIFGIVGLLLFLCSAINYTNMASARAASRLREIGIRKASGARSGQIAAQLLQETGLLCLLSGFIAVVAAWLLLPSFNTLTNLSFGITDILNLQNGMLLAVAMVIMTLLAGIYPAKLLSGLPAIKAMKGNIAFGQRTLNLRHSLVTFQLAATVFTVAGTVISWHQWQFMSQKNLGINTEQIVRIPLDDPTASSSYRLLRNELEQIPEVIATTGMSTALAGGHNLMYIQPKGKEDYYTFVINHVDTNFVDVMGLTITQGRKPGKSSDPDLRQVLVNETVMREQEWATFEDQQISNMVISGVIQDFHFKSLKHPIEAQVLVPTTGRLSQLYVKLNTSDMRSVLSKVEAAYSSILPQIPFTFHFMDEEYASKYREEERLIQIFLVFASLVIVVSALGLFGLTMFTAARKSKEIGIRKVLGASTASILAMQFRQFTGSILLASVFAIPLIWWISDAWLAQFPYKIDSIWGAVLIAMLISGLFLMATIAWKSWRVASENPVKALRSE